MKGPTPPLFSTTPGPPTPQRPQAEQEPGGGGGAFSYAAQEEEIRNRAWQVLTQELNAGQYEAQEMLDEFSPLSILAERDAIDREITEGKEIRYYLSYLKKRLRGDFTTAPGVSAHKTQRYEDRTKTAAQRWLSVRAFYEFAPRLGATELIASKLAGLIATGHATPEQRWLYCHIESASDEEIADNVGDPQWAAAYRALVARMATAQAAVQEG